MYYESYCITIPLLINHPRIEYKEKYRHSYHLYLINIFDSALKYLINFCIIINNLLTKIMDR